MTKEHVICESPNYVNVMADSVVTVGSNQNGVDTMTFTFMVSNPVVVVDDAGKIDFKELKKQKIASINMNIAHAEKFYSSLKKIFEDELPSLKGSRD